MLILLFVSINPQHLDPFTVIEVPLAVCERPFQQTIDLQVVERQCLMSSSH